MANPYLNSVTPLLAVFWGWILLFGYWAIASLFVRKTKSSESILMRSQHQIPVYLALYLIFSRHGYFLLHGPIYRTNWDNWIVYPGLGRVAAGFAIAVWARVHL